MGNHRQSLLGRLRRDKNEVVVVGAGVSGLLAAHYARRAGWDVTLHEAGSRAGGLIQTVQTPCGPAETAAHSFLMTPAFSELFAALGLTDELVRPLKRSRYIFARGRMKRMPLKAMEIMGLMRGLARVPIEAGMTVAEFGENVLGTAGCRYLLEPAMAGIFAGDPAKLDLAAVLPFFDGAEGHTVLSWRKASRVSGRKGISAPELPPDVSRELGIPGESTQTSLMPRSLHEGRRPSRKKGMYALRGGMEQLINALVAAHGPTLKLNAPLRELSALRETGANVIIATDAATAGTLLTPYLPPALAARLAALEYVPLLTTTVFVKKAKLSRFKEGVGVLSARDQGVRALGVLFNSSAFPGRVVAGSDLVSLTMMYGGALDPAALAESDDRVRAWIVEDLSTLLGFTGSTSEGLEQVYITRWKRALPHYTKELRTLWPELAAALPPGMAVFGNWTGQVSLRGMVESLSLRFPDPQTH